MNSIGVSTARMWSASQLLIPRIVSSRTISTASSMSRPCAAASATRRTGRFDLAISLEVAEHLAPQRSESLVRDLCALADVVLFAAAVPFQGGAGHVNERWQSWWAQRFTATATRRSTCFAATSGAAVTSPGGTSRTPSSTWNGIQPPMRALRRALARPPARRWIFLYPELFRGKVARLKNGNIVQKMLNAFRQSAGEPRVRAFETPLWGDEAWRRDDAEPKA